MNKNLSEMIITEDQDISEIHTERKNKKHKHKSKENAGEEIWKEAKVLDEIYFPNNESLNTKRKKKKHKAKENVGEEICNEGTVLDETHSSKDESLKPEVMTCESEHGRQYAFGAHKELPNALEVNYNSPKIKKKRQLKIVETENQTYSPSDESLNTKRKKKKHKHKAKQNTGEEICNEGTMLDETYSSNDESLKQEVMTCESKHRRQYAFGYHAFKELPNALEVSYNSPKIKNKKTKIVDMENQIKSSERKQTLSEDQKHSSLDIDPGNDNHDYLENSVKKNDIEKAKKKKHKESKVA